MSTQSVSVPDLIKLVGGDTDTFDEELAPVEVLLPPQAVAASAKPKRTDGMTMYGRFMSFSSLKSHRAVGATQPLQGCVRIVDGYTMMQTDWQYPLWRSGGLEGGSGCQEMWSSR